MYADDLRFYKIRSKIPEKDRKFELDILVDTLSWLRRQSDFVLTRTNWVRLKGWGRFEFYELRRPFATFICVVLMQ